ncbi:hypothetical protein CDAR_299741 [Caerostris darwini]|uniref:Uncharacterized protein n=1 Tax=Caerostris darwini TaxID=1538125 RepID=A0AAV4UPP4_9ARAC|nr:hypothetical protein CDAR_299741 [Caerostris darwini]
MFASFSLVPHETYIYIDFILNQGLESFHGGIIAAIFQHDNTRFHVSSCCSKNSSVNRRHFHFSSVSDLSTIEQIWDIIDMQLRREMSSRHPYGLRTQMN